MIFHIFNLSLNMLKTVENNIFDNYTQSEVLYYMHREQWVYYGEILIN